MAKHKRSGAHDAARHDSLYCWAAGRHNKRHYLAVTTGRKQSTKTP